MYESVASMTNAKFFPRTGFSFGTGRKRQNFPPQDFYRFLSVIDAWQNEVGPRISELFKNCNSQNSMGRKITRMWLFSYIVFARIYYMVEMVFEILKDYFILNTAFLGIMNEIGWIPEKTHLSGIYPTAHHYHHTPIWWHSPHDSKIRNNNNNNIVLCLTQQQIAYNQIHSSQFLGHLLWSCSCYQIFDAKQ